MKAAVQSVRRLCGLFDMKGYSLEELVVAMADGGLMDRIFKTELLAPTMPWASAILTSLKKVAEFFKFKASQDPDKLAAGLLTAAMERLLTYKIAPRTKAAKTIN